MITTLLVPGLDGSAAPHWQHWWEQTDPTALMVELSSPSKPVPAVHEVELASMVLQHRDCVLVGHSLGAVLIVRLLAKYPHLPVAGVVLVAPAETQGADRIGHFGPINEQPFDVPAVVVASRNDPWMSFARAAHLARAWGADFVDLGMAGHVNVDAGFGPWPEGKLLRDDVLSMVGRGASGFARTEPARAWPRIAAGFAPRFGAQLDARRETVEAGAARAFAGVLSHARRAFR